jgi:hypothetical protein
MGQKIMRGILRKWFTGLERPWMSGDKAADEIMGLFAQAGWAPPEAAHKMVPLIRRAEPPYLWAGDPDHNGVELKDGDTVEIIVGGELVRGRLKIYGELLTLRVTVDMDVIALEHRAAAGESICGVGASHASKDWEPCYGFPMPDCILLRKVS